MAPTPVDKPFSQAQDHWSERLISEEKFSDAVAILGPEGHRVPFIRAHLATLSEPLCAALYGDFKENSTREITLLDVSEDAFDVMQRSSHHLDPKLTPERAIAALHAAKLYLIDDLSSYCLRYLNSITDLELKMQAMSAALKMQYSLPTDLIAKYFKDMVLDSKKVIQSPVFLSLHGSIIRAIIGLDELEVNEEVLWSRLLQWSAEAVRIPETLGPFAETICRPAKRARVEFEQDTALEDTWQGQQLDRIVQMISKHIRFAAMTKEFYYDHVRPWLSREDNDAVTGCLWLGRDAKDMRISKREGLNSLSVMSPITDDALRLVQMTPFAATDAIQSLVQGSSWKPPNSFSCLRVSLPCGIDLRDVGKVELTFSPGGSLWTCKLGIHATTGMSRRLSAVRPGCWFEDLQGVAPAKINGRDQIFEVNSREAIKDFCIAVSKEDFQQHSSAAGSASLPFGAASLAKVTVFKKNREEFISELAKRLAGQLEESIID